MSFDQPTRNRLARFVGAARTLLTSEFTRQLQHEYGLDPTTGAVSDLTKLSALDDSRRQSARLLRITLDHYLASNASASGSQSAKAPKEALERIVREQAFTVLNRLSALRMAESRGLLIESIARGYQSKGFQLYARLAGTSLGETGDAYRAYLFSLFDEFAIDLPVLFDRFSPQGRLFPRPAVLLQLLDLINNAEIAALWTEDETIGWIYQYFNSKEERKQMRDESQAPRNSRELAVRNQFFTPRYVVEFLTDNTLGRIWYEMTQGSTTLIDSCRYLVRRPHEIFLAEGEIAPDDTARDNNVEFARPRANHATHPDDAVGDTARGVPDPSINDEDFARPRANHATHPDDMVGDTARGVPDPSINDEDFARPRANHATHPDDAVGDTARGVPDPSINDEEFARPRANHETDLSQEELLRQPVYIPFRPRKDPRTILMLDPACGSMHFGLYSFDLYEVIYDEAWEIEAQLGAAALLRPDPLRPLHETYPDKATFLRDVPRLIIEQNIHGIDIDPRAVQIAGLSLWLRAQKSWHALGVKPQERPQIARSNIVCAEPMPGDRGLLEEFLKSLREERLESLIRRVLNVAENQRVRATPTMAEALCDLVRTVWKEMELAGEAGSLLKIEESLATAIARGRQEWDEKMPLFRSIPGEEEDFWDRAEALVLAALAEYAEQAESGDGYQRRLFADDAARGFAFIDLCRKRYDVVLMNPPFGAGSSVFDDQLSLLFVNGCQNLASAFVEAFQTKLTKYGSLGQVSDKVIYVKSSYTAFRENVALSSFLIGPFIELGWNVLDDANVAVVSVVLSKSICKPATQVFFNLSSSTDKQPQLSAAIEDINLGRKVARNAYICQPGLFLSMPNKSISYDIPSKLLHLFRNLPSLRKQGVDVLQGHNLSMEQFGRLWWEIQINQLSSSYVIRMYKGGEYCQYYQPSYEVAIWKGDGSHLRDHSGTRWSNERWQGQHGIGYGKRGDCLDAHILPAGHIFTVEGMAIFPPSDAFIWGILTYLNSPLCSLLLSFYSGQHKEVGYLRDLPTPLLEEFTRNDYAAQSRLIFELKQSLDTVNECSPIFYQPFLRSQPERDFQSLAENFFVLAGKISDLVITQSDRMTQITNTTPQEISKLILKFTQSTDVATIAFDASNMDTCNYFSVESSISYGIGCILGRWDIRCTTEEKATPQLPDPFAPLPFCPPGMLQNTHGLPATPADVPAGYPLRISWQGILVDDEGHAEDIERRTREVIRVIWQERADAIEQEACELLGVHSPRDYFRKPAAFFADHLKRYSKSRRAAPIYWPLSTPSGSYMLWLYYHRLSDQTLYTCVNDFVDPKLKQVRAEVNGLRQKSPRSSAEEKELERLSTLEGELNELRSELLRIASFWQPNLNDGVQITAAPLWKLFQHRPWQKKLKETWGKLAAGDYDWAHLAYSIWPERVAAKCKSDKSLAIAHDLEHLYVEPPVIKKANTKKKKEAQAERLFEDEE